MFPIKIDVADLRRAYLSGAKKTGVTYQSNAAGVTSYGRRVSRMEFDRANVVRFFDIDRAHFATYQDVAVIDD